jgi:hypothetical protein
MSAACGMCIAVQSHYTPIASRFSELNLSATLSTLMSAGSCMAKLEAQLQCTGDRRVMQLHKPVACDLQVAWPQLQLV